MLMKGETDTRAVSVNEAGGDLSGIAETLAKRSKRVCKLRRIVEELGDQGDERDAEPLAWPRSSATTTRTRRGSRPALTGH